MWTNKNENLEKKDDEKEQCSHDPSIRKGKNFFKRYVNKPTEYIDRPKVPKDFNFLLLKRWSSFNSDIFVSPGNEPVLDSSQRKVWKGLQNFTWNPRLSDQIIVKKQPSPLGRASKRVKFEVP